MELAFYLHDLNPVLLPVAGPLAIRWYGLAYVAGFAVAYGLLVRWARAGWFRVTPAAVSSLLMYIVLGVMLGGRIGYLLFYTGGAWLSDPLMLVRLWEGGMASHGGMLGLTVAMWIYSRQQHTPFLHLTDGLVCAGTIGLAFGRLANFINGELWGRVTTVPWAVLFPQEAGLFPPRPDYHVLAAQLVESGLIQPRHPSQLYAALLEGVLVWSLLMGMRRTRWAAAVDGRLSGLFLAGYAVARVTGEFFREPEIVHFGWVTQGQVLSLLMLVPALYLLTRSPSTR